MAKFDVINKETGEAKVIDVSVHEIQQWYKDNPDWERDWSEGAGNIIGDVGEWKTTNVKKNPGWKDVLDKVRKVPGNTLSKDNLY